MKVTNKQSKKLYIPRIILRTSIFLLLIGGVIFLTLSGIIDFFVVKNDYSLYLADIPKNKDATFIQRVVPPGAIVLNSTWFYHPASIAGRAIYNGYAFFTWSAGYDTYKREGIVKQIYRSEDKREICQLLKQAQITYVELNHSPDDYLKPISEIWQSMTPILYENPKTGIKLFQVQDLCR